MQSSFQPKDLIETLVRIEQNGLAFYTNMAEKYKDDKETSKFFSWLADQEKEHEKMYKSLASSISDTNVIQEQFDGEYDAYIQTLINQSFEFDSKYVSEDLKDAYKFSMGLEKDTILFIEEASRIIPNYESESLEYAKNEERNHIKLINEWYQENK